MTLRLRRIIYILLIAAFFIVAPLIILYNSGYRYNFKKKSFQKTGIIFVSAAAKNVNIFLDGKLVAQKTPIFLKNLFPGNYNIKIEADNYLAWEKELSVQSQLTTFVKDLVLLKESLPIVITGGQISKMTVSPDKNYLAFIAGNKKSVLSILDLKKNETIFNFNEPHPDTELSWSPDGKWLVAKKGEWERQVFAKTRGGYEYVIIANFPAGKIFWSKKSPSLVYIIGSSALYSLDLENKKSAKVTSLPRAQDYLVLNDTLWFVSGDALKYWDFTTPDSSIEDMGKTPIANAKFGDFGEKFIALSNDYEGFLVDALGKNIAARATKIKKIVETPNEDTTILYNDFEIWLFNQKTKTLKLVTRIGSPITSALWHSSRQYIIFTTDKEIRAIELDSREPRNEYNLVKLQEIKSPLKDDGENFYFAGKISENEEGIFELGI
jgi:dipeptidyl aminopeptidase/acylaminoacyl peptidase